jgi:hypothetical protein
MKYGFRDRRIVPAMLTSRRDYLLRIIDEVGRILASVVFKRRNDADQEALETIMVGYERLFGLDADQVFLLTPAQHFKMLAEEDDPDFARDKLLLYAALSAEAGAIYEKRGNRAMARATRLNALQFTLKAQARFGADNLPKYAPKVPDLLAALADEPLDADTAQLVSGSMPPPPA